METNSSLLNREVLSLGDRRVVGTITGYHINCDTFKVEFAILTSKSTKASLALPIDKIYAVGDAFVTIETQEVMLDADKPSVKHGIANPFLLVGVPAFTKTGNKLADVASFEFSSETGDITKVILADQSAIDSSRFVFFQPEFAFFDDAKKPAKASAKASKAAKKAFEEEVEEEEIEIVDEDGSMKKYLLGQIVTSPVTSDDGAFSVGVGIALTEDMLKEAEAHGALIQLTMSVD